MNLNNPIGYKSNQPLQKPFIMNPFRFGGDGSIGGWKELKRTTLESAGDSIDVTSLPNKRYYMVLGNGLWDSAGGGYTQGDWRFNADTGGNYADRWSVNGGGDGTNVNINRIHQGQIQNDMSFQIGYISNLADKEKLMIGHQVNRYTAGSATAPERNEYVGKWANTTNVISGINFWNSGTGNWDIGSELVVLGWDPTDTHTTNFWEELASATAVGGTETFETGTFAAKKYLWVQAWIQGDGTNNGLDMYVNSDTGTNYSYRYSTNGAGDTTGTLVKQLLLGGGWASTEKFFMNAFIVNNSANEKLAIGHVVTNIGSTGAGNPPTRREETGKWANTSTQITKVGFKNRESTTGQNISAGSMIKVWGHD